MKTIFKTSFLLASLILILSCNIVRAEADLTPPTITLLGETSVALSVGDTYVDAGASANDDVDGDITSKIVVNNLVNTSVAGNYTVTYNVSDVAGNNATEVTRSVVVNNLLPVPDETFIIRNGDSIIWQGTVPLPSAGTISISDYNGASHLINSQSVLALLYSIDQATDTFSISNLQYYDSFGSFYLKCILPTGGAELCDNWQYAVGNTTPGQSIATTTLTGNNTVGIFFGSPHRLTFNSNSINVNTNLSTKAENYNYTDNTWSPLLNISVGVTLPNPTDPWNPTVVSTQAVDGSGVANFIIAQANTYNVGIVEDFYFPSYQINVLAPVVGGGATITEVEKNVKSSFDITKAINFLKKNQSGDGSFAKADLYTDWAAIAYSAAEVGDGSRDLLLAYLKSTSKLSSNLTDNERRAMALLSLGQNPYDFEKINYIDSIVKQFDGTQFGDSNLVNDDVFALLPLLSSGYSKDDEIIKKDVAYILFKQDDNGSWNNSVDLSSATIQALNLLNSIDGVSLAIDKAEKYIVAQQQDDGSFDSVYSTSWAEQARLSLNKAWQKNNNTPLDYLAKQQAGDGAVLVPGETLANRIWATSYAIPAALGKTWNNIFKLVPKMVVEEIATITNEPMKIDVIEQPIKVNETQTSTLEKTKFKIASSEKKSLGKKVIADNTIGSSKTASPQIVTQTPEVVLDTNNKEKPLNRALPFVAGAFIVIGGFFVARFWV